MLLLGLIARNWPACMQQCKLRFFVRFFFLQMEGRSLSNGAMSVGSLQEGDGATTLATLLPLYQHKVNTSDQSRKNRKRIYGSGAIFISRVAQD